MKSYSPKKMCFMVKMNDIIPRTNKFDKTTAFKTKKGWVNVMKCQKE